MVTCLRYSNRTTMNINMNECEAISGVGYKGFRVNAQKWCSLAIWMFISSFLRILKTYFEKKLLCLWLKAA